MRLCHSDFTMCESTEQCICIKFCFKIGKPATETYQLLQQAYGEDAMGRTQLFDWFLRFKEVAPGVKQNKGHVNGVLFFYSEGIVHNEYVPDGQTINKDFYLEILRSLRESVRRKRPEKWRESDWILHHDNAPANNSHLVQQFLAKHGTDLFQKLPYSPDLVSCDFFLFPRLKKVLKGHRFEATEDIKRNLTKTLLDILKEEFAKCFQQWQKRWAKCVAAEWNYIEDNYG